MHNPNVHILAPVVCEECDIVDSLEVKDNLDGTFEIITNGWWLCDNGETWICPSCHKVGVDA